MKTSRVDSGKLSCLIFIIYLGSLIDHGTARSSTPPPAIRLYEVTPDGKEAKLLTGDPDSEISLELGKEYRLECTAGYPVQWVYIGNGVPVLDASIATTSATNYKATALIPVVTEQHTGKYKCINVEKPHILSYFYIYAPGPAVFSNIRSGKTLEVDTNTVLIPCTVTSPMMNATLIKIRGLPIDRPVSYFPRRGFLFQVHDVSQAEGTYHCKATYMGKEKILEFHVGTPEPAETVHTRRMAPQSDQPRRTNESRCFPSCARNAHCVTTGGVSVCKCMEPYKGDGYMFCELPGDECTQHDDCPDHLSCFVDSTCRDPCTDTVYGSECGRNGAVCTVSDHELVCECPAGKYGDPLRGCFPLAEGSEQSLSLSSRPTVSTGHCKTHTDCSDTLSCFTDGYCRDPCADTIHRFVCGRDAICRTVAHRPLCTCPGGFYGDPYKLCLRKTPRVSPRQLNLADLQDFIAPMV